MERKKTGMVQRETPMYDGSLGGDLFRARDVKTRMV